MVQLQQQKQFEEKKRACPDRCFYFDIAGVLTLALLLYSPLTLSVFYGYLCHRRLIGRNVLEIMVLRIKHERAATRREEGEKNTRGSSVTTQRTKEDKGSELSRLLVKWMK